MSAIASMEDLLATRPFFDREDAAVLLGIHHRDIEPGPLFQKLQIALAIVFMARQADQKRTFGNLRCDSAANGVPRVCSEYFSNDARHA